MRLVCAYCNSVNEAGGKNCVACGAALPAAVFPDPVAQANKISPSDVQLPPDPDVERLKEAGKKAEQVYSTALNAYAVLWRTLGEALAIAVAAFALGLIGGATGAAFAGLLGAALMGGVVGSVVKHYLLVAISAPLGALLGAGVWGLAWALGAGPGGMVYAASLGAIVLAWVGGRRILPGKQNIWERLRPFLGALGGVLFALLGVGLGLGLRAAVQALF